jgi:glycosyltransferase involved in cell wall biosynthesis
MWGFQRNIESPTLYCYPAESEENFYIQQNRIAWERIGYSVSFMPNTMKGALSLWRTRNSILVLNWFEDRLGHSNAQVLTFIKTTLLLAIMNLFFSKIIWVRHNLEPHSNHSRILYRILLGLIKWVSNEVVTHRPVQEIKSKVVPHPLYPICNEYIKEEKDIEFICFGAVKKYKGIDSLLNVWPKKKKFFLVGRCVDEEYKELIMDIVKKRGLDFNWINEFVSYDELSSLIGRSKFVILPHQDNSMLVSGAFYHAASLGTNILTRDSDFYKSYLTNFSFVHLLDYQNIDKSIDRANHIPCDRVLREVHIKLSSEKLDFAWKELLCVD